MAKRTIRHALFTYSTGAGSQGVAFRGQTVDLSDADVERGDALGAFTDGSDPAPAGDLAPFPKEGTDGERDSWVRNGTIEEIVDAVGVDPEIRGAVIAAEERRGKSARKTLLTTLAAAE